MSRLAAFIVTGFALAVPLTGSAASAQTSPPHPLRPTEAPPPALAPAGAAPTLKDTAPATSPEPSTEKPPLSTKRPRSPAQRANDERMRACGREWRAQKNDLKARGLTWYRFSAECRARLKGQRV